ncbi:MAG: hypothetical protein RLZZ234_134, partial [Candidatus Parcubacteria bacterium]
MDTSSVQTLIQACEWLPSHFLVVSPNVYTPFLYYTYLGCAIPALLIALFVFIKLKNNLASRLLICTNVSLALWVLGSMVVWATEHPSYVMYAWTLINVVEPFVYFFAFYFAYVFMFKRDLSTEEKLVYILPLLPTIILAPTSLMLSGFDLTNCDRNAFEGILALYGYAVELFYVCLIIFFASHALTTKDVLPRKEKRPVAIFAIGIVLFLVTFSLGNTLELMTENWYIGQYGLLGAPLFSGLLAYLIIKFHVFNIKLFSIHAFMASLWLLLCSLLFIRESENANIIILGTLVLFILVARPLAKSVAGEIEGREMNAQMAADLKAANARLQDLDRTKSEFVSIASHQLRTPLTAIRGFAELMRDGSYGPIPEKFYEPLAHIEESVQNMAMTINDFLNVSRIESGTMQYDPTVFSLHELTERIWGELKQYAEKRNLQLLFEPKTFSPLVVEADEGKVRQILQNLIDNSIKYTPSGTVTIELELTAGNMAVVSIVDTGIG